MKIISVISMIFCIFEIICILINVSIDYNASYTGLLFDILMILLDSICVYINIKILKNVKEAHK